MADITDTHLIALSAARRNDAADEGRPRGDQARTTFGHFWFCGRRAGALRQTLRRCLARAASDAETAVRFFNDALCMT